jgi:hypothetical protein
MKIVIVPSHNQSLHIKNIIAGYEKQTIKVDLLLFVLDRCSDNSEEVLKNINSTIVVMYVKKTVGNNFSAGMTRDFGLECIKDLDYEILYPKEKNCLRKLSYLFNPILRPIDLYESINCGNGLLYLASSMHFFLPSVCTFFQNQQMRQLNG